MTQRGTALAGGCLLAIAVMLIATPAIAQQQQQAEPAPDPVAAEQDRPAANASDPIIVTGSRITGGFSAPTPVTVLGNDRVQALAITNIGDALNQLPSFRATSSPATQATNGGNVGARLLDLRGLGAVRTLVLVDGRRFVPSTSQGTVDVNLIPSALVQQTEVVTGGASAAYGSDAVAGVVNFILDRDFTGIKGEAVYGISERGDDESVFGSLAFGSRVGESLHLTLAGEYEKTYGMGGCYTRDWCATQTLILQNPLFNANPALSNGLPANLIVANVNTATVAPGGLINRSYNALGQAIGTAATDPLRGTAFTATGASREFDYGTLVGPLFMLGGEGNGTNSFISPYRLKVPVERYSLYGTATLDITSSLRAKLDASYGRVQGEVIGNVLRDFNGSLLGQIKADNAFLPDDVAAAMADNGVASFVLGKADFNLGPARALSTTETYRVIAALEGDISSRWQWNLSYQYGRTNFRQNTYNSIILGNLRKATDSVLDGNNNPVCRVNSDASTANDDPSCVAYNPFGEGQFSAGAASYVVGDGFQTTRYDQHVVAANLMGDVFDLPAGAVKLAVGGEYRSDKIEGQADAISLQNQFWSLNGSALQGSVNVKEAYAELAVPVFSESALGYSLDINGAIRRTDYSTSGAVTTWKAGAVYEPFDGLRLRITRSRDIRAPNLAELVGPLVKSAIGLTDPRTGEQTNPTIYTGSNVNLRPEKADSWTIGAVATPRSGGALGRMRFSVDYYSINVNDAIGVLGAQTLANRCEQGVTEFCDLITRDPITGSILEIRDVNVNSQQLKTSGFDIEFQYRQPLGAAGEVDLSLLANFVNNLTLVDPVGETDRAGQNGVRTGTLPGVPDYVIDGVINWKLDDFRLTAHGRYIPKGIFWTNFVGPDNPSFDINSPLSVNNNLVPDRFYLDLAAQYTLRFGDGREFQLFGTINNVLDRDPPIIPGAGGGTNQILYDPVGRSFKIGVRANLGGN